MQYEVQDKIFINDQGNQVKYKRLVITGYVDGGIETLELPISKDQATIYRLMSNQGHEVHAERGGNVNTEVKTDDKSKTEDSKLDLFD